MQKLLSIIIPVYKVEQYINKCLDSCIIRKENGTIDDNLMSRLDIIIVNDGTPDCSAELSREYVKMYPETFRQIDKENGGHGSAWNVGLKEAKGTYVRFLDSDDWLTNLDKLMHFLLESDCDLVYTPIEYVYEDNSEENRIYDIAGPKNEIIATNQFEFYGNRFDTSNFWFATYKREVLVDIGINFQERCYYDDALLTIAPYVKSKTLVILDFILYHWRLGQPNQTTAPAIVARHAEDRLLNHRYMVDYFQKWENSENITEQVKDGLKNIIARHSILVCNIIGSLAPRLHKKGMDMVMDAVKAVKMEYRPILPARAKRYKLLPFPVYYSLEWFRFNVLHR